MDLGIAGKWALVCGSSKGLGLGCAQALVREGVNVVIAARGAEGLQGATAGLLGDPLRPAATQVLSVASDVTTPEGRAALFAVPGGPGVNFDIVVTNAGGPPPGDFRDWDREAWIKAVDANMLTPIELIKTTIDGMAERGFGRIVNITSSSVKSPIDILGLSNGARSGLTGFVAGVARARSRPVASPSTTCCPASSTPTVWPAPWAPPPRKAASPSRPSAPPNRPRSPPAATATRPSSAPSAPSCAACMPATSRGRTSCPMVGRIPERIDSFQRAAQAPQAS